MIKGIKTTANTMANDEVSAVCPRMSRKNKILLMIAIGKIGFKVLPNTVEQYWEVKSTPKIKRKIIMCMWNSFNFRTKETQLKILKIRKTIQHISKVQDKYPK